MKGKTALVLMLLVFVLPVGLAKLILDLNWYQGGVTNRGHLLEQPLSAAWLAEADQWKLVYLMPEQCDARCQGALFNLRQIPQAMGAGKTRVGSVLLVGSLELAQADVEQKQLAGVRLELARDDQLDVFRHLEFGGEAIYIADPLGNVMMAYPLVSGKAEILAQGKDVLRDLKRLLKVSKIG